MPVIFTHLLKDKADSSTSSLCWQENLMPTTALPSPPFSGFPLSN